MSDEMVEMIMTDAAERMDKVVAHVRHEFSTVRTGRPNPSLVERIAVEYYGSEVPLQQLASFSVPEAQLLVISPFDRGAMENIERAIRLADLGLSPSNDGTVLRLSFPPLTEERRKTLVKQVKAMAEDGRIAIRNARRSARQDLEQLGKDGDVSEDVVARAEKELDQVTQGHEAKVNDFFAQKEQELLEV